MTEVRRVLKEDGFALISFRNRTFNAFSANAYTLKEVNEGKLKELLESALRDIETDATVIVDRVNDVYAELSNAFPQVLAGSDSTQRNVISRMDEQFWKKTMNRRQHSLGEVKEIAEHAGLKVERLFFFHFHPFPPIIADLMPELSNAIGLAFERFRTTKLGMLFASSFVAMLRAGSK